MKNTVRRTTVILFIPMIILPLLLGCGKNADKKKALKNLCDNFRTSYTAEISYSFGDDEDVVTGNAVLGRDGTNVILELETPEPYCGLSVEYDTNGLPSSAIVHFSGVKASLPPQAISKINAIAVLAADDFLLSLSKRTPKDIEEYITADGLNGYCTTVSHNDAQITVFFSEDGNIPYSMEYISESLNANITFSGFSLKN